VKLGTSTITSSWGANIAGNTGNVTAKPANSNTQIAPGSSASFGFCANRSNATISPSLAAWNFELNVYQTCQSDNGKFPALASLAVAMGKELGRWNPNTDLVRTGTNLVGLSSTGLARCTNGCKNTKALLGQEKAQASWFDGVFDPVNYGAGLWNAFGNQTAAMTYLQQQGKTPPAHKLTLLGGPMNLGVGACGPHYLFQVDNADGTAMTSTQAAKMSGWLCYFGMDASGFGCGANPYLGFLQTGNGCPAGRTCIAIDPTDGDNGTTSTTSAGSAPTYPRNSVYDPDGTLLGTACITTKGKLGSMVSKCSAMPDTCGYSYCV